MKLWIGTIVAFALVISGFLGGNFLHDAFFADASEDAPPVAFEIPAGASVQKIGELLEEQELIDSSQAFQWFVKFFESDAVLQAGGFELPKGLSYASIVEALGRAEGGEVQATIPEGLTLAQVGEEIRAALPHITEGQWREATGQASPLFEDAQARYLLPEDGDLEGYLFPDTYRFHEDADAHEVARAMWQNFVRRLEENGVTISERDRSIRIDGEPYEGPLDFHEAIILASVVEREVRSPEDMAAVADIFLKRLRIGMALQADSTVNYVTGKKTPSVSAEDLGIDSPYNTYKYPGLPPGPISHPGMDAIMAVLEPEPNEYYYFLTTPEGQVKYAETFDEHVENRQFLR